MGLVSLVLARALVIGDTVRLRSWVLLPMAAVFGACGAATVMAADGVTSLVGMALRRDLHRHPGHLPRARAPQRPEPDPGYAPGHRDRRGRPGRVPVRHGLGAGFGDAAIRAIGTFGAYEILSLASVVTYALLVAVAIVIAGRGLGRALAVGAVAGLAVPLAVSLSRGAWIAAAIAIVAMVLVANIRVGLMLLLASVVRHGPAADPLQGDVDLGGTTVRQHRLGGVQPRPVGAGPRNLWQVAGDIWHDHPVTGVGLRHFPLFRDTYAPMSLSSGSDMLDTTQGFRRVELLSPHNFYLLVLSELGIVGAMAFAIYFTSFAVASIRRAAIIKRPPVVRIFGLTSVGVVVGAARGGLYGDLVGGATTVLTAVLLGCVIWWASGVAAVSSSKAATSAR